MPNFLHGTKRAVFRENDMVKDFNLQKLTGANQIPRGSNVSGRRFGIPPGVTMRDHNGMGFGCNGWEKDFARMNEHRVKQSLRDNFESCNSPPGVKKENDKTFLVPTMPDRIQDIFDDVCVDFGWRVAYRRSGAFFEDLNLEFHRSDGGIRHIVSAKKVSVKTVVDFFHGQTMSELRERGKGNLRIFSPRFFVYTL